MSDRVGPTNDDNVGSSNALPAVPEAYDWEAFRRNAHETIDFIVNVQQQLARRELPVQSTVSPGYLFHALPEQPPEDGEPWDSVMSDVQSLVLPGITHWQHPDFYAFFPAMMSPPALLGDLMANSFNTPGFNWACCPAATELEMHVMNWLARAFQLPPSMRWEGAGGGVMQPTATEAMIVTMLAARSRKLEEIEGEEAVAAAKASKEKEGHHQSLLSKFVCYHSDQAHFCVEKSAKVLSVSHCRTIPSKPMGDDGNYAMDIDTLKEKIKEDIGSGLIPFYISANFGATGICAIDPLVQIAALAQEHHMWCNVDAAYAGVVALCPEHRRRLAGIEQYDSVLINGSKWFSTMFNANFMFFQEKKHIVTSLNATGVYLANPQTEQGAVIDFKDYHLGLGRPFRSLKVYTTIKSFGLEGLRAVMRRHMLLAEELVRQLKASGLFLIVRAVFGLVCFQLKDRDAVANDALLSLLNSPAYGLYLVSTLLEGKVVLRISLSYPSLTVQDITLLAEKIIKAATEIDTATPTTR